MPIDEDVKVTRLRLKAGQERRLLGGHSWVFSNEIDDIEQGEGPTAILTDASGKTLGVGLYNPKSLIAWRLLSRKVIPIDSAFFMGRLESALRFRDKIRPGEDCYRLCFGESDALPGLVIDRYGKYLVVQVLSAGMESLLETIIGSLKVMLKPAGIYMRNDHKVRELEGLPAESKLAFGKVPDRVKVREAGLEFWTPLTDGQKTGFYFDQSENRAYLKPLCKGRRVLDLYCYTGAFALNAAAGGAVSVHGVDSSESAIAFAKENAELNKLDATFLKGDAEEALRALPETPKSSRPDLILIDPPSFVPSKKHLSKAARAYVKLNSLALKALPSGGLLATSTCSHHVSREVFMEILRQAQEKAGRPTRLRTLRGQGGDHPILLAMPETEYLNFALLEVL